MNTGSKTTRSIVMCALLSAIVLVFQYMGSFIKFGPFSVSLVLVPIVIGAAVCGTKASAWLGFVFGLAVLISGDAAAFMVVSPLGTVLTVLVKGVLCGLAAGIVYNAIKNHSAYGAVILSAIVCPIVNTGVFLIGCKLFFMSLINDWAQVAGFADNAGLYMIVGLVGFNFLFEMLVNVLLSPIILRLLKIKNN